MSPMKSALVVVAALTLAAPNVVHACSCMWVEADDARRAAAFVFEGTVTRMERIGSTGTARATFQVRRVWKGSVGREITLRVPAQPSMCPPHFAEGQTFIVYAENSAQGGSVGACARYGAGQQLASERRELGNPLRSYRPNIPPPG